MTGAGADERGRPDGMGRPPAEGAGHLRTGRWLLWALLAVALALAFWPGTGERQRDDRRAGDGQRRKPMETMREPERPRAAAQASQAVLVVPVRKDSGARVLDLFAGLPPAVVPRPAAPAAVPIPASESPAPALPYTYLGRFEDGKTVKVFLQEGELSHAASPGDAVSGGWRLVAVRGREIEFLYEPTQRSRTLTMESK